jgi:CarD family transcriptional regulator
MSLIGSMVVYPGYGVALVSRELIRDINDVAVSFYELKFLDKDVTILVPKDGFEHVGIRALSTKKDVEKIYDIFRESLSEDWLEETCKVSWNRRNKDYQNRIRNGDLIDVARIYRDLKYIAFYKGLSFGEKAVLSQVGTLLSEECSAIEKKPIETVVAELKGACEGSLRANAGIITKVADSTVST